MRTILMTRTRAAIAMAAVLLSAIGAVGQTRQPTVSRPQVIAYVFPKDRLLRSDEIAAGKLTRINYAFANIRDGQVVEGALVDAANLAVLSKLRLQYPSLQIFVSVGGWLWSGHFSDAVLTPASRARFIESAVVFLQRYHLDGLDIDWEYPGMVGAGNKFRSEDKQNFTLLLSELRTRFDQEQVVSHRPLLLSIAAAGSAEYLAHTEMGEVQRYLDTINLMAYDYYEPDDGGRTGNHAPLFPDPSDPKKVSAASSVSALESAGVPARKIVLGVPFYGHVWSQVNATRHGLFQSGAPADGAYAGYDAIAAMIGHDYVRYWDEASKAPYLYSAQRKTFVSYEDPESLRHKCAYVREQGLAGIMFWEYFSDPSGVLLDTISTCWQTRDNTGKNVR